MKNASGMGERRSVIGAKSGFVAVAVALVGLVGLMGLYAAPVPLARAMVDAAAIAQAAAAPAPDHEFAVLAPRLEPAVAAALAAPGPVVARVANAQVILADLARRQAQAVAARLRLLLGIVTLMAIALGIGIAGAGQGGASQGGTGQGARRKATPDKVE